MKSYVDQAGLYFKDKISNPLVPTFITSWCFFNYQVFIFLFSSLSPDEKVSGIRNVLNSGVFSGYGKVLIFPLLASILYVFLYPFVFRWVMVFIETQKVKTNQKLIPINEENPRTTKEFEDLDGLHKKKNNELRREIQELEQRIEQNKLLNSEFQISLEKLESENNKIKEKYRTQLAAVSDEKDKEVSFMKEQLETINIQNSSLTHKYQQIKQEMEVMQDEWKRQRAEELQSRWSKQECLNLQKELKILQDRKLQSSQEMLKMQEELKMLQQQGSRSMRSKQQILLMQEELKIRRMQEEMDRQKGLKMQEELKMQMQKPQSRQKIHSMQEDLRALRNEENQKIQEIQVLQNKLKGLRELK